MKRFDLFLLAAALISIGAPAQTPSSFTVSPSALSFGNVIVGSVSSLSFTIVPQGSTGISFSIFSSSGAFTVSPLSIGATTTPQFVTVNFTPNAATGFSGQITVIGSGPPLSAPTQTVSVTGTGISAFTVSPTSLSFGNVLLNCSSSQLFTISPGAFIDFSLQSDTSTFSVSPDSFASQSPRNVTVVFTPTVAGPVVGSVNIVGSQQGREAGRASVSLAGTGSTLTITPASVEFGQVRVGGAPATQTVRVTRGPSFPVTVSSSSAVFTTSQVSAAGDVQIAFAPPSSGVFNGTLTFTVTDPATPACTLTRTVSVRGVGVTVDVSVSPVSLDFGAVRLGTTSTPRSVTLTNGSSVEFNGTATSNNAAFAVRPTTFTVGAGRTQSLDIDFAPRTAGPQTGGISFALVSTGGSDLRATLSLTLSGEGQRPAELTTAPDRIDFGDVGVGASAVRTITVSNPGGTPADVTGSVTGGFSLSPNSFNLAAGGSRGVSITFAPTAAGALEGTATFTAAGITRTVAMTGRGVVPTLSFSFASGSDNTPVAPGDTIPFPPTIAGSTNSIRFQINNTSSVSTTFSTIASSATAFVPAGLPTLPFPLPPGGSLSFNIVFRPESPGSNRATLNVDGRGFTLTGTGLLSGARITGTGGNVTPGQQPTVGVTLTRGYPVEVKGRLTLSFSLNALGGDDPAIQFVTGGRTTAFTVPANSTTAMFGDAAQIGFQSGTVAGTIEFRATFEVDEVDVGPTPVPAGSVTIARAAPVIRSATATRTPTGIRVDINAFATTREVSRLDFQFNAATGANLGTTRGSLDVSALFVDWYGKPESAAFGSAFLFSLPFTAQGDPNAARSISVTLSNGDGSSQAVEAVISP